MKKKPLFIAVLAAVSSLSYAQGSYGVSKPVAVYPSAAAELQPKTMPVKESVEPVPAKKKAKEQALPGIGTMPGDPRYMKTNVVPVRSDRTEVIYISNQYANRISTPFNTPRAVDTKDAEVTPEGQSLYVLPKSDKPVALFVTGGNPGDPVVSLTLVPKAIPPQTIVLQMDTPSTPKDEEALPESYTGQIRYIMRSVALGRAPEGYSEGALPKAVARMGDLVVVPETRYSGSHYDIYRYRVESVAGEDIELQEASFYQDGVRAVGIFPNLRIKKGEVTSVFVVADKSAIPSTGDRP